MRLYLAIFLLVGSSDFQAQSKKLKIEFLGMQDGCPNTPKMWTSLQDAIQQLHWKLPVDRLDLLVLSQKEDIRAGYGSPTILVNGKDLFGEPVPPSFDPSCRVYRGGVPGAKQIAAKLKALYQSPAPSHQTVYPPETGKN